jgi:LmbE family N-acetylglucosaminyl deacetylase
VKLTIQVISPHLDDAVLSCADHIRCWRDRGHCVEVATLFTDFGTTPPSDFMAPFIRKQGFKTVSEYADARRLEDSQAMAMLGVSYRHAGLCDAGFRCHGATPIYKDYRALTSGIISPDQVSVLEKAQTQLQELAQPDVAIAPLGIGGHVDHVIAREACRTVWGGPNTIGYYADFPYARNPRNYSFATFKFLKQLRFSVKFITDWKRNLLAQYRTQTPYFFRSRPRYPEILFLPSPLARPRRKPVEELVA